MSTVNPVQSNNPWSQSGGTSSPVAYSGLFSWTFGPEKAKRGPKGWYSRPWRKRGRAGISFLGRGSLKVFCILVTSDDLSCTLEILLAAWSLISPVGCTPPIPRYATASSLVCGGKICVEVSFQPTVKGWGRRYDFATMNQKFKISFLCRSVASNL